MLYFKRQWVGFDEQGIPTAYKYVYYSDRVEMFYNKINNNELIRATSASYLASANWMPYPNKDEYIINHPYGIPFVHFANRPDESPYGESELHDIYGLQDAINTQLHVLANVGELCGYKQGIFTGVTQEDFPEKTIDGNPSLKMMAGDFLAFQRDETKAYMLDQSTPDGVLSVINSLIDRVADVSLTPRSSLESDSGGTASSGYALSKIEAPLIRKCEEGQVIFGSCYEDVFRLVISQARKMKVQGIEEVNAYPEWMPLTDESPSDKLAKAQENQVYIDKQVVSRQYVQRELGLTQEEIDAVNKEIAEEQDSELNRIMSGLAHADSQGNQEPSGNE
jgi:hypothetical protein